MKFKYLMALALICTFSATTFAEDINLQQELTPKIINNEQVEVRAYKHADGATISEYRSAGKVWMIKVQPAGNFPAYYLYDNEGHGTFERHIMGNKALTPPMWIIKRF